MEEIKEYFPHPHIPAQPGMPTFEIIAAIHRKLKSNAASVTSTLGGGNHGLLGLTILPATYQTVTGHVFVAPVNPGSLPIIAPTAIQPQIGEAVRQHKERLKIWKKIQRNGSHLKKPNTSDIRRSLPERTPKSTCRVSKCLSQRYDTAPLFKLRRYNSSRTG